MSKIDNRIPCDICGKEITQSNVAKHKKARHGAERKRVMYRRHSRPQAAPVQPPKVKTDELFVEFQPSTLQKPPAFQDESLLAGYTWPPFRHDTTIIPSTTSPLEYSLSLIPAGFPSAFDYLQQQQQHQQPPIFNFEDFSTLSTLNTGVTTFDTETLYGSDQGSCSALERSPLSELSDVFRSSPASPNVAHDKRSRILADLHVSKFPSVPHPPVDDQSIVYHFIFPLTFDNTMLWNAHQDTPNRLSLIGPLLTGGTIHIQTSSSNQNIIIPTTSLHATFHCHSRDLALCDNMDKFWDRISALLVESTTAMTCSCRRTPSVPYNPLEIL